MNKSERDALVQRYTQGHSVVVEALAGITPAELDARHDGWSVREVVHHLAGQSWSVAPSCDSAYCSTGPVKAQISGWSH